MFENELVVFLYRFALVHEGHTCPRHAILEKILSGSSEDECCLGDHDMTNNQREMISIIKSAQEILG